VTNQDFSSRERSLRFDVSASRGKMLRVILSDNSLAASDTRDVSRVANRRSRNRVLDREISTADSGRIRDAVSIFYSNIPPSEHSPADSPRHQSASSETVDSSTRSAINRDRRLVKQN